MARHLSSETLADLAESGESHPHAAACARCREQLQQARDALAEARHLQVPEPSPLFWERLSARVRAGVEDEAAGRSKLRPYGYIAWLPAVAGVLIVCAVAVWLVPRGRQAGTPAPSNVVQSPATPSPAPARGAQAADVQAAGADMLPPSNDPSWNVIAHVASAVPFEESVLVQPGATDLAVAHLSVEEQQEFMRLLKGELSSPPSQ